MKVQPYLFFNGRCDEAIEFYRRAVGAEVQMLMRFKDSPDPAACAGGAGDSVMHACFTIGETSVMASDGMPEEAAKGPSFQGFSLSISAADPAEADRLFNALGDGGRVTMPLGQTFFSPSFGMLIDRFGVGWMVVVNPS